MSSLLELLGNWSIDPAADAKTTLGRMARRVRAAVLDPWFLYAARNVIASTRDRDTAGQIAAIRAFLLKRFMFVPNPLVSADESAQGLSDAKFMLEDIGERGYTQGACDDAAVLAAALAMACGIPARFRAIAFCESSSTCAGDEPLSHVIADVFDGADWRELDVTRPRDVGRPPAIARTLIYDI